MKKMCVSILFTVWGFCCAFNVVQAQEKSKEELKKEELRTSVLSLRNQEVRVAVLQQMVNQETGQLQRFQKDICDKYELDVEKFKAGLYRYDNPTGTIIETKIEEKKEEKKEPEKKEVKKKKKKRKKKKDK